MGVRSPGRAAGDELLRADGSAGIIFSSLIGEGGINISTAFAYNLMGALFGVMEYNSMYFGFAFLYLLALGFYVLAFVFSRKSASLARPARLAPAE